MGKTIEELREERDKINQRIQEIDAEEQKNKYCPVCNGTGLTSIKDQADDLFPRRSIEDSRKKAEYIKKHSQTPLAFLIICENKWTEKKYAQPEIYASLQDAQKSVERQDKTNSRYHIKRLFD